MCVCGGVCVLDVSACDYYQCFTFNLLIVVKGEPVHKISIVCGCP